MRVFIAVLVLIFSLQSWSKADDIRDFQIEGMSIGDSLLDYFSEKVIEKNKFFYEQAGENKKYTKINLEKIKNIELYDRLGVTFRTSDERYKTTTVEGIIWFKDDINSCLKKRDEIIKELSELFKNNQKEDAGKNVHFADKKSYTYDYYVYFGNINDWPPDHILVSCYDWSKKLEYWDHLRVAIVKKEYMEWLNALSKN